MDDDDSVAFETGFYPPAEITPAEFEQLAVRLLESLGSTSSDLEVTIHDRIRGVDGLFDFDATVRFTMGGMRFLVLAEAKRHKNPIKRELVQVLHRKLSSVGGQKAIMISTAPFQRGALDYAKTHGIALVTVTEGRYTFETKSKDGSLPMSREQARLRLRLPDIVGHVYGPGESPGSTSVTLLDPEDPDSVQEALLGQTSTRYPE